MHVWHDSSICGMWDIYTWHNPSTCDMTHPQRHIACRTNYHDFPREKLVSCVRSNSWKNVRTLWWCVVARTPSECFLCLCISVSMCMQRLTARRAYSISFCLQHTLYYVCDCNVLLHVEHILFCFVETHTASLCHIKTGENKRPEASNRKNWRILQLNRSKIGTTNALQCQVPVWWDHANALQHTATHCNTHSIMLDLSRDCNALQRTATHCNALQHSATHTVLC